MARPRREERIREAIKTFEASPDTLSALAAARHVREAAELLEREAIGTARSEGISWAKIGGVYGLTKQGAQQRFKARPNEADTQATTISDPDAAHTGTSDPTSPPRA